VDLFDGCDAMDNIPDGRDLMKGSLVDGSDEVELQMQILEWEKVLECTLLWKARDW
jgi:hypothetical protein